MHHAPRRTLARPATLRGVGLFSARPAALRLVPAPPGAGLAFRRTDLPNAATIPAHIARLCDQPQLAGLPPALRARNTILWAPPATVLTTEHILSALAGLGITDALIELDAPEIPIADGSARPFTEAILDAGIIDHGEPLPSLVVEREITVRDPAGGEAFITASPRSEPGCEFLYELDYGPGAPIPPQRAAVVLAPETAADYAERVAPARTFCLQQEAEAMRAMGLFQHLTPRDMLVLGPDGPIDNTLRFDDEPARHKLLDLIGDLALAGRPIQARITARRSGHALNQAMAKALLA